MGSPLHNLFDGRGQNDVRDRRWGGARRVPRFLPERETKHAPNDSASILRYVLALRVLSPPHSFKDPGCEFYKSPTFSSASDVNSPPKTMVHLSTPQPDTGHFTTLSARPSHKPSPSPTVSTHILFPRNHYQRAPNLAAGFSGLDLACSPRAPAVRANLVGHNISRTGFDLLVETWGPAVLHRADATWIEHAAGARECQFGQVDTRDVAREQREERRRQQRRRRREQEEGKKMKQKLRNGGQGQGQGQGQREGLEEQEEQVQGQEQEQEQEQEPYQQQEHSLAITFPRPFTTDPTVIVWLNRLDLRSGEDHNYRINASATRVTRTGFVAHLDTWADGAMDGAAMAWIAFPAEKRRVASGVVRTADVRSWGDPRPRNSGWVRFPGRLYPPSRRKEDGLGAENKENEDEGGKAVVNGKETGKEQKPTVLIALKMQDMAGNADLRIKTYATDVTKEGFRWHLDTWDDSTLYAAEASWIALGFA